MIIDWQVASQLATVGAFVFTSFTFVVTFWRTRRSEQLKLIREILKDRGHLANQLMELETKKTLSDPSESGVYIVPIRDLYVRILNQWSEFVFLSQAGEITDKKLIQRYVTVFEEDLQRARDNGVTTLPSQELQKFMKEWNIS